VNGGREGPRWARDRRVREIRLLEGDRYESLGMESKRTASKPTSSKTLDRAQQRCRTQPAAFNSARATTACATRGAKDCEGSSSVDAQE
jgi:hypothetical protein